MSNRRFNRPRMGYEALPQVASDVPKGFVPYMTVTDLNGRVIATVPRDYGMPEAEWRATVYAQYAAADRYIFVNRSAR